MKKIAVLTSGGDAPGMNPAIRAVVRSAIYQGLQVIGIKRGYQGLLQEDFVDLDVASVGDIVTRGGTILRTARSEEFHELKVQQHAAHLLRRHRIEGLVVIGGDGSFRGALSLHEQGMRVIGIPGTIDNDIHGTESTIGFDTAVNTGLDGISKLRDTATSHERLFLVEVMGRHCGAIALAMGIAGGAEAILIPEMEWNEEELASSINRGKERGKISSIIIIAEGTADTKTLGERLTLKTNSDVRTVILGHLQRGGAPTAGDSVLASRMGAKAVEYLLSGLSGVMTALRDANIVPVSLELSQKMGNHIDENLYHLAKILAI